MFNFNSTDPDANEKPSLLSNFKYPTWRPNNTTKIESEDPSSTSPHSRAWIKGVVLCSWVIATVLAINIVLTIIAVGVAYSKNGEDDFAFAALYTGKCSLAKNWATGIHLIINILSTALLGASNYCMQCLASPSRAQVDTAHSKRVWLPIGVPNIRGLLWRERGKRQLLGWILLATSLPIHLIYNSAIFFSIGPADYAVVIAPPDPMNGTGSAGWNECFESTVGLDIETVRAEMSRSDLKKLSIKDCIDTFAQDYVSGQRMLVLVTEDPMPDGEPLAFMGPLNSIGTHKDGTNIFLDEMVGGMCPPDYCSKDLVNKMVNGEEWTVQPVVIDSWVRARIPTENGSQIVSYSSNPPPHTPDTIRLHKVLDTARHKDEVQAALDDPSNWTNASFPGNVTLFQLLQCPNSLPPRVVAPKSRIRHCLTLPRDESCRLMFSPPICLLVIGCNLVKLICALLTAHDGREELFLTIGDAIASYLACPDTRTEGGCLLSKSLVVKGSQGWHRKMNRKDKRLDIPVCSKIALQLPSRKRWFQAVSTGLWISTITLFLCIIGLSIFALIVAIDWFPSLSREAVWDNTLGEARPSTLLRIDAPPGAAGTFAMILLPNALQLLVSTAYFILNAMLTAMLGAMEYNDYARNRKPLRVSWPRGAQRSTYYLSLPYRYSFPLLVASAVLHWVVSQSFFFVQITPFDIHGEPIPLRESTTCGYSPIAILVAIIVFGLLLLVPVVLGLRRFESPMPLVVQCSAAISAACHPTTSSMDDSANHALKPVQWGEIPGIYSDRGPMVFSHRIDGEEDDDASGRGGGDEELQQMLPNAEPNDLTRTGAAILELYHCTFTSEDVCEPRKGCVYI
ncbi:hypothetical protein N7517_004969 [Penicillium concentricum]|uniref:DUF6536 domain-containing protein n=1 Tax=Penicillium concentricum TaxID=293559 RepID=A0A9W9S6L0_9EURO|nr:uncharacterized protein N7517_004969 [Penicillium concentricum]KAJ5372963.1 hypothetical protein N7517_004969 [Penicillium concentricum]